MSVHVFGAVVTAPGVAANNRGETEGNITTLQKILWRDQVHTTVSAEAIRWAIRYNWQINGKSLNRRWDDDASANDWQDPNFEKWLAGDAETFIDDDVLGFMKAEGAKSEGEKGHADKRRAVLEVTRAVSLTPYAGDLTFNAASVGATPSAARKGSNPVPYGTEVHATRYQYGFAMTPDRLRVKGRAREAIEALVGLGEVAGNHGRFLFDFSPESIVLRLTDDPAPRILFCFEQAADGSIDIGELIRRVQAGDINVDEVFVGGRIAENPALDEAGVTGVFPGVKKAAEAFFEALGTKLGA